MYQVVPGEIPLATACLKKEQTRKISQQQSCSMFCKICFCSKFPDILQKLWRRSRWRNPTNANAKNLKCQEQHRMKSLNCLVDHISYQTLRTNFKNIINKDETLINHQFKYKSTKFRKKVKFKIKTQYYLELITPETVKLLKSTGRRISNNKNGENKSHLDVTKVVLIHGIMVDNHYQHDSKVLSTFQISHMVSY